MPQFLPGRSYLVVGVVNPADVSQVLPIDRLEADGSELGIKELRILLSSAAQRPYGDQRLLLLKNADQLTEACQTTLLKTLEEPSVQLTIVLEAASAEPLLATVRSRLQTYTVRAEPAELAAVLPADEAAAAKTLQAAKDRSALGALLQRELQFRLQRLRQPGGAPDEGQRLSLLEQAMVKLERNSNQKLVIDWLLLHWFPNPGNN